MCSALPYGTDICDYTFMEFFKNVFIVSVCSFKKKSKKSGIGKLDKWLTVPAGLSLVLF